MALVLPPLCFLYYYLFHHESESGVLVCRKESFTERGANYKKKSDNCFIPSVILYVDK